VEANGATEKQNLGDTSLWLPTNGRCSVLIVYHKTDGTNRASGLFGLNSASLGNRCGCHGPWADGTIYWDYGGATGGATRLSVSGQTFESAVWVFTVGSRGMEIWKNGKTVATNAAQPARSADTPDFEIGGHGTAGSDNVIREAFGIWDRQLEPIEIRALAQNPFAPIGSGRPNSFGSLIVPRQTVDITTMAAPSTTVAPTVNQTVDVTTIAAAVATVAPSVNQTVLINAMAALATMLEVSIAKTQNVTVSVMAAIAAMKTPVSQGRTGLSCVTWVGDGVLTSVDIQFDYLHSDHIVVTVDAVAQEQGTNGDYTVDSSSNVVFATAPASGTSILICRQTPHPVPLVNFTRGAPVSDDDITEAFKQCFFYSEEVFDDL
jgi:hypothetical protein